MRFIQVLLILLVPIEILLAQDTPVDFFPKDYVQSEGRSLSPDTGPSLNPQATRAPPSLKSPGHSSSTPAAADEAIAPTTPANVDASMGEAKSYPVVSVAAVVNSKDRQHFIAVLEELWQVAARYDFDVGRIYAIGDIENTKDLPIVIRLIARGGRLAVIDDLPVYPKLERSPAWIVSLESGDVILEGVGDLAGYFTPKGEFRPRYRAGVIRVQDEADVEPSAPTEAGP